MRAKVKYEVIYRHRSEYPISVMCQFFGVSRSGYYDYVKRMGQPEKDGPLAAMLKQQQERCRQTYGYRRMHLWLEGQGIHHNPKTVLRVMKKYGILSEIRRKRKWQKLGQQVHKYQNLLNRCFEADKPNSKWVTDISYIHTKEGVLYLSMIRDLYDNSIIAYKTASQQTVNLVLDTIRLVQRELNPIGFERQIFPHSTSKPLTIQKVFSADFSLIEKKFARSKLLCTYQRENFEWFFLFEVQLG